MNNRVMEVYWAMRSEAIAKHNVEVASMLEADTEILREGFQKYIKHYKYGLWKFC